MLTRVKTKDGFYTFHNRQFDEHYHSVTAGAMREAEIKFVGPAGLKTGSRVLDFCFGLGYNTLAALNYCRELDITGIEIDSNILMEIPGLDVPPEYRSNLDAVSQAVRSALTGAPLVSGDFGIRIIIRDGSAAVKSFAPEYFDAVFFDPFSPARHFSIWSKSVFHQMYRVLKPGGRLTTYSCARRIRENMAGAGFSVLDGPVLGRRGPSTVAIKAGKTEL